MSSWRHSVMMTGARDLKLSYMMPIMTYDHLELFPSGSEVKQPEIRNCYKTVTWMHFGCIFTDSWALTKAKVLTCDRP